MLSFVIPERPRPKLRHRMIGRRLKTGACACKALKDPKTRVDEALFAAHAHGHRPAAPLEGPLAVELLFVFVPAKDKRKRAHAGELAHVIRPDVDNLSKLALDAMNGVFWVDDTQIVSLTARKTYGKRDRTEVTITPVAPSCVDVDAGDL